MTLMRTSSPLTSSFVNYEVANDDDALGHSDWYDRTEPEKKSSLASYSGDDAIEKAHNTSAKDHPISVHPTVLSSSNGLDDLSISIQASRNRNVTPNTGSLASSLSTPKHRKRPSNHADAPVQPYSCSSLKPSYSPIVSSSREVHWWKEEALKPRWVRVAEPNELGASNAAPSPTLSTLTSDIREDPGFPTSSASLSSNDALTCSLSIPSCPSLSSAQASSNRTDEKSLIDVKEDLPSVRHKEKKASFFKHSHSKENQLPSHFGGDFRYRRYSHLDRGVWIPDLQDTSHSIRPLISSCKEAQSSASLKSCPAKSAFHLLLRDCDSSHQSINFQGDTGAFHPLHLSVHSSLDSVDSEHCFHTELEGPLSSSPPHPQPNQREHGHIGHYSLKETLVASSSTVLSLIENRHPSERPVMGGVIGKSNDATLGVNIVPSSTVTNTSFVNGNKKSSTSSTLSNGVGGSTARVSPLTCNSKLTLQAHACGEDVEKQQQRIVASTMNICISPPPAGSTTNSPSFGTTSNTIGKKGKTGNKKKGKALTSASSKSPKVKSQPPASGVLSPSSLGSTTNSSSIIEREEAEDNYERLTEKDDVCDEEEDDDEFFDARTDPNQKLQSSLRSGIGSTTTAHYSCTEIASSVLYSSKSPQPQVDSNSPSDLDFVSVPLKKKGKNKTFRSSDVPLESMSSETSASPESQSSDASGVSKLSNFSLPQREERLKGMENKSGAVNAVSSAKKKTTSNIVNNIAKPLSATSPQIRPSQLTSMSNTVGSGPMSGVESWRVVGSPTHLAMSSGYLSHVSSSLSLSDNEYVDENGRKSNFPGGNLGVSDWTCREEKEDNWFDAQDAAVGKRATNGNVGRIHNASSGAALSAMWSLNSAGSKSSPVSRCTSPYLKQPQMEDGDLSSWTSEGGKKGNSESFRNEWSTRYANVSHSSLDKEDEMVTSRSRRINPVGNNGVDWTSHFDLMAGGDWDGWTTQFPTSNEVDRRTRLPGLGGSLSSPVSLSTTPCPRSTYEGSNEEISGQDWISAYSNSTPLVNEPYRYEDLSTDSSSKNANFLRGKHLSEFELSVSPPPFFYHDASGRIGASTAMLNVASMVDRGGHGSALSSSNSKFLIEREGLDVSSLSSPTSPYVGHTGSNSEEDGIEDHQHSHPRPRQNSRMMKEWSRLRSLSDSHHHSTGNGPKSSLEDAKFQNSTSPRVEETGIASQLEATHDMYGRPLFRVDPTLPFTGTSSHYCNTEQSDYHYPVKSFQISQQQMPYVNVHRHQQYSSMMLVEPDYSIHAASQDIPSGSSGSRTSGMELSASHQNHSRHRPHVAQSRQSQQVQYRHPRLSSMGSVSMPSSPASSHSQTSTYGSMHTTYNPINVVGAGEEMATMNDQAMLMMRMRALSTSTNDGMLGYAPTAHPHSPNSIIPMGSRSISDQSLTLPLALGSHAVQAISKLSNRPGSPNESSMNASNNMSMHWLASLALSSQLREPLYVVEFKSGRCELFYVPDYSNSPVDNDGFSVSDEDISSIDSTEQRMRNLMEKGPRLSDGLRVKMGDWVVVEADRGEDLGRISGVVTLSWLQAQMSLLNTVNGASSHVEGMNPQDDEFNMRQMNDDNELSWAGDRTLHIPAHVHSGMDSAENVLNESETDVEEMERLGCWFVPRLSMVGSMSVLNVGMVNDSLAASSPLLQAMGPSYESSELSSSKPKSTGPSTSLSTTALPFVPSPSSTELPSNHSYCSSANNLSSSTSLTLIAAQGAFFTPKDLLPKRIHRLATPLDLSTLTLKSHEESLAILRCGSRVRSRQLPMEILDAEYQWDRNKLTFYFTAQERIDFRELVRELFRMYKTRIWMCAAERRSVLRWRSVPFKTKKNTSATETK